MQKPKFTYPNAERVTTHAAEIPDALRNFDQLPDSAYVRLPVVSALLGCSPATVWRRAKAGVIHKPRNLGGNVSAWNVGKLRHDMARLGAQ